ncbi:MAG: formyltransferase family protein [Wenzhouxiangella sp.]|jgi:methionyl-tRNA formyltransferase|nr:formyltransferase family protein [Wenzhouxiangella sp.]
MERTRIVFIGGMTDGKVIYDYLNINRHVEVGLVVTYPDGSEKPRHVDFPSEDKVIKSGTANGALEAISRYSPDLIFVAGWSELLNKELLDCARNGVIGFHPSKLPMDRGRSVLAWQIEEGYTETAVSMFYYTDIPDGGDIIAQERISIEENDYVNDVLDKVDEACFSLMRAYFPLIRAGKAPRRPQHINEGNFRRLRTNRDSQIDWGRNKEFIFNKIRAISKPYPAAEAWIGEKKFRIFKAEMVETFPYCQGVENGSIVASFHDGTFLVKCRNGFIRVLDFELNESGLQSSS